MKAWEQHDPKLSSSTLQGKAVFTAIQRKTFLLCVAVWPLCQTLSSQNLPGQSLTGLCNHWLQDRLFYNVLHQEFSYKKWLWVSQWGGGRMISNTCKVRDGIPINERVHGRIGIVGVTSSHTRRIHAENKHAHHTSCLWAFVLGIMSVLAYIKTPPVLVHVRLQVVLSPPPPFNTFPLVQLLSKQSKEGARLVDWLLLSELPAIRVSTKVDKRYLD